MNSLTDLHVIAELTDTEAIKEAVKSGMGISCVSRMAVNAELLQGHIGMITIEGFDDLRRSFYVITRKGRSLLPQVKALVEIIDRWKEHEKN